MTELKTPHTTPKRGKRERGARKRDCGTSKGQRNHRIKDAHDPATETTCKDGRSRPQRGETTDRAPSVPGVFCRRQGWFEGLVRGLVEDAQKGMASVWGSHVRGIMEMGHGGVESGTSVESSLLVHCKC